MSWWIYLLGLIIVVIGIRLYFSLREPSDSAFMTALSNTWDKCCAFFKKR